MNKAIWRQGRRWTPATLDTTETTALFTVEAGVRVRSMSARVEIAEAGGAATQTIGDGDDVDGYFTDAQLVGGTVGLKDAGGAYTNQSGGKLYLADDTIDVVHTVSMTITTKPVIYFSVTLERDLP